MLKDLAKRALPERAWTELRLLRQRLELYRYPSRVVEHDYGGLRLKVQLSDPLGEGWYDRDWPPLPELAQLRRGRLRAGARVFALGAHQGVVALLLARAVSPGGKVIAVEANEHNARLARRNRELNACEELVVVHGAAAEGSGTIGFNRGLNGHVDDGGGGWGLTRVPAFSVDDLARRHGPPDVLYVDVEGYEQRVLEGARRTLAAHPDWCIEVHVGCGLERYGGSVEGILARFPVRDYARYVGPVGGEGPQRRLVTYDPALPFLRERFHLVALARERA